MGPLASGFAVPAFPLVCHCNRSSIRLVGAKSASFRFRLTAKTALRSLAPPLSHTTRRFAAGLMREPLVSATASGFAVPAFPLVCRLQPNEHRPSGERAALPSVPRVPAVWQACAGTIVGPQPQALRHTVSRVLPKSLREKNCLRFAQIHWLSHSIVMRTVLSDVCSNPAADVLSAGSAGRVRPPAPRLPWGPPSFHICRENLCQPFPHGLRAGGHILKLLFRSPAPSGRIPGQSCRESGPRPLFEPVPRPRTGCSFPDSAVCP